MAVPNCQAGQGKDGAAPSLGKQWLLQKGEDKEASTGAVVSGRGGAVLECGNLFKGGAAILVLSLAACQLNLLLTKFPLSPPKFKIGKLHFVSLSR
jgi:hypothetical protein